MITRYSDHVGNAKGGTPLMQSVQTIGILS
jgi:hypothetical protein